MDPISPAGGAVRRTGRRSERPVGPPRARHLLSLSDIATELPDLLARAEELKRLRAARVFPRSLQDRSVALLFETRSLRARSSFELGVQEMGGHAVYVPPSETQFGLGESIADVAQILGQYCDAIVYRAHRWQDEEELARWASVPVLNAQDDREDPCPVVSDLLSLREHWRGRLRGHRLAYVGAGGPVLNSLVLGCAIVGMDLAVALPESFRLPDGLIARAEALARGSGASTRVVTKTRAAVRDADATFYDSGIPRGGMAAEARRRAGLGMYTVSGDWLDLGLSGGIAGHDQRAQRRLELADAPAGERRGTTWDDWENLLHVEKAILERFARSADG
jgi:ornithine carbamoyltransferase